MHFLNRSGFGLRIWYFLKSSFTFHIFLYFILYSVT